jgi:hypothetical protein
MIVAQTSCTQCHYRFMTLAGQRWGFEIISAPSLSVNPFLINLNIPSHFTTHIYLTGQIYKPLQHNCLFVGHQIPEIYHSIF